MADLLAPVCSSACSLGCLFELIFSVMMSSENRVHYPTSAVHKAVHGGQHAYLTDSGVVEAVAPLSPLPYPRLDQDVCGGAAGGPQTPPSGPESVPRPTDFGIPLQPPIPADTTYSLPSPGGQSVPLWRSASGHFLVGGVECCRRDPICIPRRDADGAVETAMGRVCPSGVRCGSV